MSVARRERKYGGPDSDRSKRVLSQPVQAWERKWTESARGDQFQICKWVKTGREIEFEDDEDDEDEEEEMDTEKETTTAGEMETSNAVTPDVEKSEPENNDKSQETDLPSSTGILNSAVDKKLAQLEEEEEHTHTPKLDDVSDHEPEPETGTDLEKDNPAAYPASNPHIQIRLEETDSLDTTPQETQDEEMEDASGVDTYQSNTATPEYTSFRADRAREVLDSAASEGASMEPSLSRSSLNEETPESSSAFDQ